jgi:hypothetical protein
MKFKPCLEGEKVSVPLTELDTDRKDGFTTVRIFSDGVVISLSEHEAHNGSIFLSEKQMDEIKIDIQKKRDEQVEDGTP